MSDLAHRLLDDKTQQEVEELLTLAIENERIEAELQVAMLTRDAGASALIHRLQSGLCKASAIARRLRGLPSLREEKRGEQ